MRHTLDGHRFSLATPEGIGIGFIAVLTLNGLIGIMAQPHLLARLSQLSLEFLRNENSFAAKSRGMNARFSKKGENGL